jgi:hypothetical protein
MIRRIIRDLRLAQTCILLPIGIGIVATELVVEWIRGRR